MKFSGVPTGFGSAIKSVNGLPSRQSGFSYIEAILAIIIITVSFSGLVAAIGGSLLSSSDPEARYEALMVAQSYMDEAQSMAVIIDPAIAAANPNGNLSATCDAQGSAAGAQRWSFNELCDYDGYTGQPTLRSGQAIAGLEHLRVDVRVVFNEAASLLQGGGGLLPIGGNNPDPVIARSTAGIEVEVSYDDRSGGRQSVLLRGYVTR